MFFLFITSHLTYLPQKWLFYSLIFNTVFTFVSSWCTWGEYLGQMYIYHNFGLDELEPQRFCVFISTTNCLSIKEQIWVICSHLTKSQCCVWMKIGVGQAFFDNFAILRAIYSNLVLFNSGFWHWSLFHSTLIAFYSVFPFHIFYIFEYIGPNLCGTRNIANFSLSPGLSALPTGKILKNTPFLSWH